MIGSKFALRIGGVWGVVAVLALMGTAARQLAAADQPAEGLPDAERQAAEDLIWQTIQAYNDSKGYHATVSALSPAMGNAAGTGEFNAVPKLHWRKAKLELKAGADVLSRETWRSGLFVYALNVNPGGGRELHRFYQDGYASTFFVPDPVERLEELNRRYLFSQLRDVEIEVDGGKLTCKRIGGTLRSNAYEAEMRTEPEMKAYYQQLATMSAWMTIDIEIAKDRKQVRQVRVLTADGQVALQYTFGGIKTDATYQRADFEYKPAAGEKVIEHEAPAAAAPEITARVDTAVDLKAAGRDDARARELIGQAQKALETTQGFSAQIRLVMPAVLQPQAGSVEGIPAKSLEKIEIARVMMEGAKGGNRIVNNGREIRMQITMPVGGTIDNKTVYMRPIGPILHTMQSPPMMLPMADLVELKKVEEGEMLEIAETKMVKVLVIEGRFDAEIAIKRLGLESNKTEAARQIVEQLRDAAKETPRVRFFLRGDDLFPVRYERLAPDGKPIYISDLYSVKTKQNLTAATFQ